MQKYLKWLEKNVQWFALGLGVLYLGYTVWNYLANPPLKVELAPGVVALPGDVDQIILDRAARKLEADINSTNAPKKTVTDVVQKYEARLGEQHTFLALNNAWGGSIYTPGAVDTTTIVTKPTIVKLPDPLPGARIAAMSTGMTVVEMPLNPAANAAAGAVAGGQAGAAAPPPPAPGVPAAQPALVRHDVGYNSVIATISRVALAKAFNDTLNKPGAPPDFFVTGFLQVQLLRQEQTANGQWGPAAIVAPLAIYSLPPCPGKDASVKDCMEYREWAKANQPLLTSPSFYPTAPDAPPWVPPALPNQGAAPGAAPQPGVPAPAVAPRSFNPARDTPTNAEERQQKEAYMRSMMQREMMSRRGYNRGGRYIPGRPFYPGRPPVPTPGSIPSPAPVPQAMPPQQFTPQPFAQNNPPTFFNPNSLTADITLLAHDATVQEGKTYRYAISYKLYNPLFQVSAPMITPGLEKQFALDGPDPAKDPAAWSKPIAIEPHTHLYATTVNANNPQKAVFDLFVWKGGHWHESKTTGLAPGDAINGAGRDANTGWTVVDVRKNPLKPTEAYVIVMDPKGVLQRRDVQSDEVNPEHQRLKAQVNAAAAAQ